MQIRSKSFDFIDDAGNKLTAHTKGSESEFFGGWTNPEWYIDETGGGPYEFLTYRGTDGKVWRTKIRVSGTGFGNNPPLEFKFENKQNEDDDTFDGIFEIIRHDETPWRIVTIDFVYDNKTYDTVFVLESM